MVFEQRFDQSLRLNLHYHGLWVDGSFACSFGGADFHASAVNDVDVERLVRAIRSRVLRFLRRSGRLTDEHTVEPDGIEASAHHLLGAAAVQGRIAFGPHAGAPARRVGQDSQPLREFHRGPLCAAADGFSLHAAVRVRAGATARLEKLCQYAARPPIVHERLSLTPDGKVLYKFKRAFRDGSSHVLLDPLTFIARLAALVPRPRAHLVTYHGLFAPAAPLRSRVVPPPDDVASPAMPAAASQPCAHASQPNAPTRKPPARDRHRYSWAELLRRVFHSARAGGGLAGATAGGSAGSSRWRRIRRMGSGSRMAASRRRWPPHDSSSAARRRWMRAVVGRLTWRAARGPGRHRGALAPVRCG